jgi:hypothetical protein
MATLSQAEFLKLIKNPKNLREIQRARAKRIRHKLHSQPETENDLKSESHFYFLRWVEDLISSEDNFKRFKQLYRVPLITNELTESIFAEFEKVFEGQNRYEKFEFNKPELENDFQEYRKKIGDLAFWQTQGFETFKDSIDNILVVDLPQQQKTSLPEPYYYILDINDLIDIENVKVKASDVDGTDFIYFKTEYIIFRGKEGFIYCFDDQFYRVFQEDDKNNITFVSEAAHNLKYCPARSFWTTPLNSSSCIQKRSVITNSLSELDWYLFFSICRKYLELYAPFPIYAVYKGRCDYKTTGSAREGKCSGGYMEYKGEIFDVNKRERCPKCHNKIRVGPGNIIELDVPRDDQHDLMANPMKIIPAERTSLDYMKAALDDKKAEIWTNCVGRRQDEKNGQARNETDVKSGFESAESAVLKVKRNFEIIHHFALDTMARLRYDASYVRGVVDYGDQFFNIDEAKEMVDFETASKNGAPSYELKARMDKIFSHKYKNDPDLLERLKILANLDPFPGTSLEKVIEWKAKTPNLVSEEDLILKFKFDSFIDRFEREQTSVLMYARLAPFDVKVREIKESLKQYVQEYIQEITPEDPPPTPPTE